jgi:Transglycosylase-like domain
MKVITTVALATSFVVVPSASAAERSDINWEANKARHKVVMRYGADAAGRDIVKYGIRFTAADHSRQNRRAKPVELRAYLNQLRRIIRPTPRFTRRVVGPPPQPPAGTQTAGVRATLPDCTWRPESGGNYNAYNSGSGARGKYQVIPSTHAAICPDLGWSPSEQEICAARIYKTQGAGAWVNC